MRLDKFLSECGVGSRKEIKGMIKQGMVLIDGIPAEKSDQQVQEQTENVTVNGVPVRYRKYVYLMLNKPEGYLSATEDKRLPVVTDLIPEEYRHYEMFPAGRLDVDTVGLLILTNDGQFVHQMTSPKKEVYKTYFARLDCPADIEDIKTFRAGIPLKDFTARPGVLEITQNPQEVYISICEGKFHQVKRMCASVGKEVVFLKRMSIGCLDLDEALKPGQLRELTEEELEQVWHNRPGRCVE